MANVYWLAIDKNGGFCTYEQLEWRGVIAQGWSDINLQSLCSPTLQVDWHIFEQRIHALGDQVYGNSDWWVTKDRKHVPRIMWMLAHLQKGDIVVGIEGTRVRGICEVTANGWESYYHDTSGDFEYTHTFGGQVKWIEGCPYRIGKPPRPPAQSVKGIANLWSARDYILGIWQNLKPENLRYSIKAVEDTLRVREDLWDGIVVYRDNKVFFKHGDGRVGYFIEFANVYSAEWILEDVKGIHPPVQFSSIEDIVRAGWVLD